MKSFNVQNTDQEAFINKNMSAALKVAYAMGRRYPRFISDLVAEAQYQLCMLASDDKINRTSHYVAKCIKHRLRDYVSRMRTCVSVGVGNRFKSFTVYGDEALSNVEAHDKSHDVIEASDELNNIKSRASKVEGRLLSLLLEGYSRAEAAEIMNISRSHVSWLLGKLMERVK